MPKPKFQQPLQATPRVVSQGSVSHPKAQPKPRFQAPLLATPRVVVNDAHPVRKS